jgi:DNA repair protein RadA/Sms
MGERVLYITEEPVTIWQHRLKMWSGDWTNLQVAFGLGADPEVLRKLAREGTATLVVVDALRNLLRLKDEKDNSEIARVVNPWVADARTADKTLFVAHHQRKGGGEHGEGISGGHALMGAFDIPVEVLWDPSKGTNRRLVRTYPRLIEAKEGLYEKVADGEFDYAGDPQAVALVEVTDTAKSLLSDAWQSTDEIWAGMDEPKPSKEQVRKALIDLAKQRVALRDPAIEAGPARGKTHRWRRPDAGSSEASATGSELSSNDAVYTLERNSDSAPTGASSNVDPDSQEIKAADEAQKKNRRVYK